MAIKVWLDTDIGSDIDDAVCLAYLLAQPECELLGISTVTGQPVERARLASALCRAAGREVPVWPGLERPLLGAQRQPEAPQAAALARWPHQREFAAGEAVAALRAAIRAHPGEVVLLAIGPFTNVGVLFALDPELPALLRGLMLMGGVFTGALHPQGTTEWNAAGDPHATAIVCARAACPTRAVGLDVTCRVVLPAEDVRARFHGPLLDPVRDFAEVWFRHATHLTFHDPLAAACIFAPDLCRWQRGRISVELASSDRAGLTAWRPDPDGPHEIAVDVDPEAYFRHFFATLGG